MKRKQRQKTIIMKNVLFLCLLVALTVFVRLDTKAAYVSGTDIKMLIGETHMITPMEEVEKWESSIPGVASVDASGTVTAVVSNSTPAVITGTHADGTTETYSVKVLAPIVKTTSFSVSQKNTDKIYLSDGYDFDNMTFEIKDPTIAQIKWKSLTTVSKYIGIEGIRGGETQLIIKTELGNVTVNISVRTIFKFDAAQYSLERGETKTLRLPVNFESYEWTIDHPEVASLELESGTPTQYRRVVTAKKAGIAVITAKNELGEIATTTIKVTATPFEIKDSFILKNGYSTFIYLDSPYKWKDCTYKIADPSIASLDTASSTGTSAKLVGTKPGNTTLTVTNQYGESVVSKVCVYNALTDIVLSRERYSVYLGSSVKISYTVSPANANNKVCFAPCTDLDGYQLSVSETGVVTPKREGTAQVSVYSQYGYLKKTVYIDIYKPYFDKSSYTLYKNASTKILLTGGRTDTKWASSNPSVATVDQQGNVKALKAGTTTVSANTGGCIISTQVTVKNPQLSVSSLNIYLKKTGQLKIIGGIGTVKWTSSNSGIVKVTQTGKVTGVKLGTATITAYVSGEKLTCKVKVKAPELSVKSKTLYERENYKLKVLGATGKISWKSSNTKIAKVSSGGTVTAVKTGTVKITAKVSGKTLTCTIKVKPNQITYRVNKDPENYRYGEPHCRVSKAYYSGSTLILDVWVMNARNFSAVKFDRLTFNVYDNNGKVIAKKKFTNIRLGLKPWKSKKIQLKFSGSSLKQKNAILNKGIDYDYTYLYTYAY